MDRWIARSYSMICSDIFPRDAAKTTTMWYIEEALEEKRNCHMRRTAKQQGWYK